ncbi:MAG: bifunctional (p)ppGpp synthetase/guanosine-3',5'-bis(diphosphate) 3'-pyrophosphohydrolase [Myxococcales bacterium]|nr:bifunctional (p)ppGpp synthetase/guanosine-3',5'-bis(diphosphate) 3'-pyrophosphohydrolase [Myxococcales bacterium]
MPLAESATNDTLETRFGEVLGRIRGYLPSPDEPLFRRAFEFAAEKHAGQTRKSGEPYIGHPLEVAAIVADLHLDMPSLLAALLHDTVEDTDTTIEEIAGQFGAETSVLVDGLTKISKLKFKSREEAQAENIRKLIVAMGRDIRVILVKLSDRLHNIRTLDAMAPAKARRIAQETLDIYSPLANRLGINWLKNELEDYAFRAMNPEAYDMLRERVAQSRRDREGYIADVNVGLARIVKERGISAEVQGRPKHFYSIFKKMQKSGVEFDQVNDLTAFRIIVSDKAACYEALGLVHDIWKPVPGRFKDYIAVPKPNGYQSLHTTCLGPKAQRVEIQIRTAEMHRIAEHGVAAHWAYKEGRRIDPSGNQFAWLRELVQSQAEIDDSQQFLDSVRMDLFADEVFVFTPTGDILSLPKGATPLDFAYTIHSEVGHHAVHAKVNGRGVSLRHELENGDTVEILTRTDQRPREEWLDIVKSSRARNKIRQYIRREERDRAKDMARAVLSADLRRYGIKLDSVVKSGDLQAAAELLKLQNVDQLLIAVGYGKVAKESVVSKIVPPEVAARATKPTGAVRRIGERIAQMIGRPNREAAVKLAGMDGEVLVTYARCCNPVYGEEIVGYVTRGRGVVVHLASCARIESLEDERRIDVEWEALGGHHDDASRRRVTIRVVCRDEPGKLSEMSSAFTSRGVNISEAHCRTTDDGMSTNVFEVMVTNAGQLSEAMKTVGKIDGVIRVDRVQA